MFVYYRYEIYINAFDSQTYLNVLEWCKQNCVGSFQLYTWKVQFERQSDAVAFKIKYYS